MARILRAVMAIALALAIPSIVPRTPTCARRGPWRSSDMKATHNRQTHRGSAEQTSSERELSFTGSKS
jgi:hypothetical protein